MSIERCSWCGRDPVYVTYHDQEWGVPSHDDRHLFEMLLLEGAQAGLSWLTILKKRDNYRRAFDQFDPARIARYDSGDIDRLMQDAGIVRNRLKIEAAIGNARAFQQVLEKQGSFSDYLWQFVEGAPLINARQNLTEVPANSAESDRMSKSLKKRGFNFVGTTICYAFMQSVGMVNDHMTSCFRYHELVKLSQGRTRP
jgi:DNA-3-methyladenine glycosylase I